MSEKYNTNEEGLYFVSFSLVGWIDVFTRRIYQEILVDSIIFCQTNKNLQLYYYVNLPIKILILFQKKSFSLLNSIP